MISNYVYIKGELGLKGELNYGYERILEKDISSLILSGGFLVNCKDDLKLINYDDYKVKLYYLP